MGATGRLRLHLLGPPEARIGQETLSFPARKAFALLVYLAVEGGMQPRERLAALLWPESSSSRARATLRNSLHQLRTALPDGGFLHVERDALGFNFEANVLLDVQEVATVSRQLADGPSIENLQAALEHYRGDFLEGFSLGDAPAFDDWASIQRERWHRRLDALFDALSEAQFERGRVRAALETTRRWLAHNELNEIAYRRLMRLYAAAGRRAAALQAYETCRELLASELGVEPAAETWALAVRVEKDEFKPLEDGKKATSLASPAASFAQGPLVGRAQQFGMLAAAHHRAAQGMPEAIVLVGHAGVGKTRLASEFLAWSEAQGSDLLRGRSFESGQQLPYQLLIDALRPRVEVINAPEDFLSDTWLAELSRLLPELRDRYPVESLTAPETEQLVAAYGLDADDGFAQWLFEETGGHPFYLVETLEDLRERGAVQIVEAAGGERQFHASIPSVEGDDRGAATNVPQKVRRVITARLSRLSPAAFDILAAGAVLSQDFTFELLCAVAAVQEGAGLRAMDELLRSQLLREFASHDDLSYIFAHDKIRDVVYTEAGEARRRVFHRRALAALEEKGAQTGSVIRVGQLARHAQAAGAREAAFRYNVLAGDESLALFAAGNAIAHYEQARAQVSVLQPSAEALRRLHVNLGRAYELAGDYGSALSVYSALQNLARERDNKPLELAALMARTTVYAAPTAYYDPDHVIVLTEEALPLARELQDHDAEAKIQWNLMLLKLFTGDIGDAVAAGEASLAIAREHDLSEREAYALHDLTRAYLFSGRAEDGLNAAEGAQVLWRKLQNKAMLADNLVTSASARFFWQGAHEALIPHLHEALTVSKEIDNLWNRSYANHVLGSICPDLGYFSRAIVACERAIVLGKQSGFMVPLFVNGSILAWLYALMGHPRRGFPWVQQGLQADTGMRDQQSGPLAAKAYLHMCLGNLDKADDLIRQSYEDLELQALSAAAFFTFPMDGRIRLARQEYEQALAVAERFMDYLLQTQLKPFRADGLLIKAEAFLALGRRDEAQEALVAARKEAEGHNTRRILWEILALQARLAGEDGQAEKARTLRKQVREIVDFIAAHIDEDALREGFLENTEEILKKHDAKGARG